MLAYIKEIPFFKSYRLASNSIAGCDTLLIGASTTILRIVGDVIQVVKYVANPL